MDEFLAIIPAKANSIRLPNKNIKILNEKPLFAHSIEQAIEAKISCVVSTDSKIVAKYCEKHDITFVWENVKEERMENCCLSVIEKFPCEYLLLLQPTHPLRLSSTILKGIDLIKDSDKNSLISVTPIRPLIFKEGKPLFDVHERRITQRTPKNDFYYYYDGVLSITSSRLLKDEKLLFDENALLLESEPIERYDMHTELDFCVVESIIQRFNSNSSHPRYDIPKRNKFTENKNAPTSLQSQKQPRFFEKKKP